MVDGRAPRAAGDRTPDADFMTSWSAMSKCREQIARRWKSIYRLPVIRRHWRAILAEMEPGVRVLDIGAGSCPFRDRLLAKFPGLTYETYDVDRNLPQDYYELDDIRGPYDRIMMLDVLEHLTVREGHELLAKARDLLSPGGRIVMYVPNIFSPSTCLWDATHITHYSYAELGGMLLSLGLEVPRISRIHAAPLHVRMFRPLLAPIYRYLRLDPATHVCLVAQKPC